MIPVVCHIRNHTYHRAGSHPLHLVSSSVSFLSLNASVSYLALAETVRSGLPLSEATRNLQDRSPRPCSRRATRQQYVSPPPLSPRSELLPSVSALRVLSVFYPRPLSAPCFLTALSPSTFLPRPRFPAIDTNTFPCQRAHPMHPDGIL